MLLVPRAKPATRDPRDLLVPPVLPVRLVLQGQQARKERPAIPDPPDLLEQQDRLEPPVRLEQRAQLALLERQVQRDPRVQRGQQDRQERPALPRL